jgi:hypothetical protein
MKNQKSNKRVKFNAGWRRVEKPIRWGAILSGLKCEKCLHEICRECKEKTKGVSFGPYFREYSKNDWTENSKELVHSLITCCACGGKIYLYEWSFMQMDASPEDKRLSDHNIVFKKDRRMTGERKVIVAQGSLSAEELKRACAWDSSWRDSEDMMNELTK